MVPLCSEELIHIITFNLHKTPGGTGEACHQPHFPDMEAEVQKVRGVWGSHSQVFQGPSMYQMLRDAADTEMNKRNTRPHHQHFLQLPTLI